MEDSPLSSLTNFWWARFPSCIFEEFPMQGQEMALNLGLTPQTKHTTSGFICE